MGNEDFGLAIRQLGHLLVSEHDAARMDPFCMLDAAAIGPVAADHVSTVHRAREPSRNAVSGDHYIGVLGENFTDRVTGRSEEHTSELQSLMRISYAVFCLKKKNNTN